jgi:hypothetical protein
MKPAMLVSCMGLALSATALADLPAALDRAPTDATVVIAVRELQATMDKIQMVAGMFPDGAEALGPLQQIMAIDGLNKQGSAAVAVMPGEKVNGQDPFLLIVPVTEYNGFAKALGAAKGEGIQTVKIDGNDAFLKDLGNGYAAMAPAKGMIEAFKGGAGSNAVFTKLAGVQGMSVADSADAFAIANMAVLRPQMEKGIAEMKAEMANDPEGKGLADSMGKFMDSFARDAQAGVVGLTATDAGMRLDGAAQFADKSEWASMFQGGGKSTELLGKLPNQSFLLAGAMDTSSPGTKKMFLDLMKFAEEAAKNMPGGGGNPMDMMGVDFKAMIEKTDGQAMILGNSPAGLMSGGAFLNTSMFVKTTDPAAYIKTMKEMYGKMNGQVQQGMKYITSYQAGAATVAGVSVDTWGMTMEAEPGNPEAEQIAMMLPMMFGPEGLGGYMAPASGGVIMTMAKNQPFLETTIKAAAAGGGLSNEESIKSVASQLPDNRAFEMYIGAQSILDQVGPLIGMDPSSMGKIPPIALAGGTSEGGARFTLFVPQQILKLASEMGGGGMGGNEDFAPEEEGGQESGQPKF